MPTTTQKVTTSKPGHQIVECSAPDGTHGISHWPVVMPGEYSKPNCPANTTGFAEWFCEKDGRFSIRGPKITCTHSWIEPLSDNIKQSKDIESLNEHARILEKELKKPERELKFHGDIDTMVNIVREIQVSCSWAPQHIY